MARPKSDDKRSAIIEAAIKVIASQGLSAPTALIAKEAGVSSGSLFTYFETKAHLLNALYVELKSEMASASFDALTDDLPFRVQMAGMWGAWVRWSASNPARRRTLAHLAVASELTEQSREHGHRAMAGVANLLERCRQQGVMRDAPLALIVGIVNGVADATVDAMVKDPVHADVHSTLAFDGLWRMLS